MDVISIVNIHLSLYFNFENLIRIYEILRVMLQYKILGVI